MLACLLTATQLQAQAPTASTTAGTLTVKMDGAATTCAMTGINTGSLGVAKVKFGQAAANAGPAKVTRLTVTGHTDTVGSDAYNMRLSRRRAESVAAQLEKDGVPSSEIAIVAKGKRDLLVPTADGVKEPQNRRVQIVYDGGAAS